MKWSFDSMNSYPYNGLKSLMLAATRQNLMVLIVLIVCFIKYSWLRIPGKENERKMSPFNCIWFQVVQNGCFRTAASVDLWRWYYWLFCSILSRQKRSQIHNPRSHKYCIGGIGKSRYLMFMFSVIVLWYIPV